MIEVFKTNVHTEEQAELVLFEINRLFGPCESSFDLEDIDRILRIKRRNKMVNVEQVINTMKNRGFNAEVLA